MTETHVWVICDTGFSNHDPVPLTRHVYCTQWKALSALAYHELDPKHYPIREMVLRDVEGGE